MRASLPIRRVKPWLARLAMWASFSAVGWISSAQSAKANTPFSPRSQLGTSIRKMELTMGAPGAVFSTRSAGERIFTVAQLAPPTRPSTAPVLIIMVAKYTLSVVTSSWASSSVMPFFLRSSNRRFAYSWAFSEVAGSMIWAPSRL